MAGKRNKSPVKRPKSQQARRSARASVRAVGRSRPKRKLYEDSDTARERQLDEGSRSAEPYRSPWRRDYARVIHSPAFRRLQGKRQLFPGTETDFFRNRLTHSIEVAQIAKSIAIRLNATENFLRRNGFQIDTDLVETAALLHDIGHPPFGHDGEAALDLCMKSMGGFEGNAQSLRIVSRLEKRDKDDTAFPNGIIPPEGIDGRFGLPRN